MLGGRLYLLGAMRVHATIDSSTRPLFVPYPCGNERTCGEELVPLRLDRQLTSAEARRWVVLGAKRAAAAKLNDDGRLGRRTAVDGIRRLHPKTARMVWSILTRPVEEGSRAWSVDRLERAVRGQPRARRRAEVLADALIESGDPRGRIMALELAISAQADPEKAAVLDGELESAVAQNPEVGTLPGGFPWRPRWLNRMGVWLQATGTIDARSPFRELIESLFIRPWVRGRPVLAGDGARLAAALGGRRGQDGFLLFEIPDAPILFRATATEALRLEVSGLLKWPGSACVLPLQSHTVGGHTGGLELDLPSGRLTARLFLPEGLFKPSVMVRAFKAVLTQHRVSALTVRQVGWLHRSQQSHARRAR